MAEDSHGKLALSLPIGDSPVVRSPNFQTIYSNVVRAGFTPWDVRVTLGQVIEPEISTTQTEEQVTFVMSPQHFKAMLNVLNKVLATWETQFGQVSAVNAYNVLPMGEGAEAPASDLPPVGGRKYKDLDLGKAKDTDVETKPSKKPGSKRHMEF